MPLILWQESLYLYTRNHTIVRYSRKPIPILNWTCSYRHFWNRILRQNTKGLTSLILISENGHAYFPRSLSPTFRERGIYCWCACNLPWSCSRHQSSVHSPKKFSRNLLHFLHQGTGYPVFTDGFGWRIGCRIRQKVQDYPTSFVYLCCLPPSCALFRKRAVRHGSVQDDEGKCKKNAWFGQKKLQNPTPIHHPTPYPTSNPSSEIPCKYYRFYRRV